MKYTLLSFLRVATFLWIVLTLISCDDSPSLQKGQVDLRQYFYPAGQLEEAKVFCFKTDNGRYKYENRKLYLNGQDTFIQVYYIDDRFRHTATEVIRLDEAFYRTTSYKIFPDEREGEADTLEFRFDNEKPFVIYLDQDEAYSVTYRSSNGAVSGSVSGFFTIEDDSINLNPYSKMDCVKLVTREHTTVKKSDDEPSAHNFEYVLTNYFKQGFGCIYSSIRSGNEKPEIYRLEKIVDEAEFQTMYEKHKAHWKELREKVKKIGDLLNSTRKPQH